MRADQEAEQGRLSGAVRTDDADRFAGMNRKVDAIEHQEGAETFRQAFRLEQQAISPHAGHPARRAAVSCCMA
jgi:glycine/serine hydroxymethyltransferase